MIMMSSLIRRIAITGGSCSGKSSSLSYLSQALREKGYRVLVVPETATMLQTGANISLGELAINDPKGYFEASKLLLDLQIHMRKSFDKLASIFGDPCVILFDRAELDIRAYMQEAQWDQLLKEKNLSTEDLLATYQGVVHLVTAAIGAEENYSADNNPARWETIDQARAVDEHTLQAWNAHPRHRVIDNSTDFAEKINRCLGAILESLGENIEIERKFLVSYFDKKKLAPLRQIEIEQTYLESSNTDSEIRLRHWREQKTSSYHRTEKIGQGLKRIEKEKLISKEEYHKELAYADPKRQTVRKTRYIFEHCNSTMELDLFAHSDLAILEIELDREDQKVEFPEYIRVKEEVTANPAYSNAQIAERISSKNSI
jgi:CYTH domain-containing protein/thymidylate kinase